ncbi:MAG: hypothetical protein ACXVIA_06995 [Halobacteriota archaeon]
MVEGKGEKQRRVPLDAETIALLQGYAITKGTGENTPLFPHSKQWIRGPGPPLRDAYRCK